MLHTTLMSEQRTGSEEPISAYKELLKVPKPIYFFYAFPFVVWTRMQWEKKNICLLTF